jgi:hypothetical protein
MADNIFDEAWFRRNAAETARNLNQQFGMGRPLEEPLRLRAVAAPDDRRLRELQANPLLLGTEGFRPGDTMREGDSPVVLGEMTGRQPLSFYPEQGVAADRSMVSMLRGLRSDSPASNDMRVLRQSVEGMPSVSARGALPGTSANPMPGPFRPGFRPGIDGLENLALRDNAEEDIARVGYDIGARARALIAERDGEGSQPDPANPVDFRSLPDGPITEDEAAERNQQYRRAMLQRGDVHPQQVLDLGDAEAQNEWSDFVRGSVDRMNRYYPGSMEAQIDAPQWREVQRRKAEDVANGVEGAEEMTPEQVAAYRKAENNQLRRDIELRYGYKLTDEKQRKLAAAFNVKPAPDSGQTKEEATRQILLQMQADLRSQNRIERSGNRNDDLQNRRITGMLNDPNTRQGFIYRSMESATPQQRSAFGAAMGDPLVYTAEVDAMQPPALPAGGGGTRRNGLPSGRLPMDELRETEAAALDFAAIDESLNPASGGEYDFQAAQRAATEMLGENADPQQAAEIVVLRMIRLSNQQGGQNMMNDANVIRTLASYAAQGPEEFAAFVAQAGVDPAKAQQMYDQIRPSRSRPRVQVTAEDAQAVYPGAF